MSRVGGVIVGLMARFGSEKIRGHGIPEAIETILFGESRLSVKVALLKPLSSAISIRSGGPFGAEGPIGMAGIMSGAMRAPLTGAIFAAELTGHFNARPSAGQITPITSVTRKSR